MKAVGACRWRAPSYNRRRHNRQETAVTDFGRSRTRVGSPRAPPSCRKEPSLVASVPFSLRCWSKETRQSESRKPMPLLSPTALKPRIFFVPATTCAQNGRAQSPRNCSSSLLGLAFGASVKVSEPHTRPFGGKRRSRSLTENISRFPKPIRLRSCYRLFRYADAWSRAAV